MDETGRERDGRPGAPGGSHVVVRADDAPFATEVLRRRRGMLTSLGVVVVPVGPADVELVRAVTDWAPPEYRVEFAVVDPPPDRQAADALELIAAHLDRLAWPRTSVPDRGGRRGDVLAAAVAACSAEFVVVGRGEPPELRALGPALGHLWIQGADAVMVPADPGRFGAVGGPERRVAEMLGLVAGAGGGVVILRRWVARFLLDDLGRALDPVEEFLDRAGLLELRVVEFVP